MKKKDMESVIQLYFACWYFAVSLIISIQASERTIGGIATFVICILLTPFAGFMCALLSDFEKKK